MLARCLSASLQSLEARPVVVDLAPGLPGVQLVGLPDKAIQESRERVRSTLRNSGFSGPLVRVVINQRGLSTRSSLQLLRVARTIADLNDRSSVDRNAVAEASCFRCTDLLKQPGAQ
ncbi:Mg chelatase-related protein [Synechococcus sp. WH 8109]|nr:Mg chelatase-related protein [Synechococcus sp. WH 8109]